MRRTGRGFGFCVCRTVAGIADGMKRTGESGYFNGDA